MPPKPNLHFPFIFTATMKVSFEQFVIKLQQRVEHRADITKWHDYGDLRLSMAETWLK